MFEDVGMDAGGVNKLVDWSLNEAQIMLLNTASKVGIRS